MPMQSKLWILAVFVVALLLTGFLFLSVKKNGEYDVKSNFECGFNSKNKYNSTFSLNYFFLTIVLVVFDLEVILLVLSINYELVMIKLGSLLAFLFFFTALLAFEWMNSIMEWKT